MRSILEGHPPVVAISRSSSVETLRQYVLTQRRRGAKKVLARAVTLKRYFGDDAPGMGIVPEFKHEAAVNAAISELGITRIIVAHRQETTSSTKRVFALKDKILHAVKLKLND